MRYYASLFCTKTFKKNDVSQLKFQSLEVQDFLVEKLWIRVDYIVPIGTCWSNMHHILIALTKINSVQFVCHIHVAKKLMINNRLV